MRSSRVTNARQRNDSRADGLGRRRADRAVALGRVGLSPAPLGGFLGETAETRGIAPDDYSRGGVVDELEARMAALLGKEAAVFMPTGTLANHLAVRLSWRSAAGGYWCSRKAICGTMKAIAPSI